MSGKESIILITQHWFIVPSLFFSPLTYHIFVFVSAYQACFISIVFPVYLIIVQIKVNQTLLLTAS